uniref:Pentatricopeptide repeat-containing protein n=1 Tax=Ananas comosus var. bracteatus TaxID=296719 RepID=A0A6V7PC61_ANACO|nr:unnamed protein product [Ananas comosus var. bracteatus]
MQWDNLTSRLLEIFGEEQILKNERKRRNKRRRRRSPKSTPHLPRPPQIHPLPSAAAASLLQLLSSSSSATTKPYLLDYPAVSSVLLRVARARLFPLLRSLLDTLRLRRGPPLRDSLFASLIQQLGRARLPDDALRLFLSIPSFPCADKSPSTHTLNSLLHALVDNARLPEARALLARSSSQQLGLRPNAVSYNAILKGCCSCASHGAMARAREGREFEMGLRISTAMSATKHRLRPESFERLIRGLCQIGKVDDACFVLEQMEKMSVGLGAEEWAALIAAVGGRNCDAAQLLHNLLL